MIKIWRCTLAFFVSCTLTGMVFGVLLGNLLLLHTILTLSKTLFKLCLGHWKCRPRAHWFSMMAIIRCTLNTPGGLDIAERIEA
jgi:hypothetical protein